VERYEKRVVYCICYIAFTETVRMLAMAVHRMEAIAVRVGGTSPLILNLGVRWRWILSFKPQPLPPISVEYETVPVGCGGTAFQELHPFVWLICKTFFCVHVTVHRDKLPCIVTNYRASWQITVHRHKLPCIVTNYRASSQITVHRDKLPCIVTNYRASWQTTVHRDKFPYNKPN
jgi:hypothetical protein